MRKIRQINNDPQSGTSASGNSSVVTTPINNVNQSRSYSTTFSGGGGEIFYDTFANNDTTDTNFVYDNWVYIKSGSAIGNLEMDLNHVLPISGSSNTNLIIMGFQCAKEAPGGPAWQYTYINSTGTHWKSSTWSCDPSTWSTNAWHHIQIAMSHDASGNVTYQAVWLDGVEMDINATVSSIEVNTWALVLLTNFQIDGYGSTGSTQLYTNGMTYYGWH